MKKGNFRIKRKKQEIKKNKNSFLTQAVAEFIEMIGSGNFSSLPCNSYSNIALLNREDNRNRNAKE